MIQYLIGWSSVEEIVNDFEISANEHLELYDILFGYYSYENWSGEAFVLLRRKEDGQLYEVNASHCSCHGLEGQWELEETDSKAITYRIENGKLGETWNGPGFKKQLLSVLDYLYIKDQYSIYESVAMEYVKVRGLLRESESDKKAVLNLINDMLTAINRDGSADYNHYRNRYAALLRKDFNGSL